MICHFIQGVDVWALGVSAIEMAAEGLPPRSAVHPMRVLFMISIEPALMLEDKEKWSLVFHDFVAKCLTKEPRLLPTASEMLKVAPKLNEDYGNTVPLGPYNIALQVANEAPTTSTLRKQHISDGVNPVGEGNFDTVIIHGDEIEKKSTQIQVSDPKEPAPTPLEHFGIFSIRKTQEKSAANGVENVDADNTLVGESNSVTLANKASPHTICGSTKQNLKTKGLCQTELEVGSGTIGRTLNNATVSQKAFALQDKHWSLRPSVYQRLTSSSTLLNLAQALAYHKMCYEDMPLQELQATEEQQTIQNLCDTLRTILRL